MPPTTPRAQPLKLADLVEYQDGSVVSRIVVKAETGNVTLFAFDEGQDLSEHTVPFDGLVHVLDGGSRSRSPASPFICGPATPSSCPRASPTRCGR